jgi:septum formation protein
LARLGLDFVVASPDVDESRLPGEDATTYVRRLALAKTQTVGDTDAAVIAADTAVVLDGEILGKPVDEVDGREMIGRLAGRSHEVITGVAVRLVAADSSLVEVESTIVHLAAVSAHRAGWYAASGEGADKAGGYALQGAAALFADRVEGSVSSVIGLPLPLLDGLCTRLGIDLLSFRSPR